MEYQIVTANGVDELQTLVNQEIGSGWVPVGGVGHEPNCWTQAMTRSV